MVPIDIVAGFLGAGKTSMVNRLLKSEVLQGKKVMVVQCEEGEEPLSYGLEENINMCTVESIDELNGDFFKQIQKQYAPEHILVEYNGTWKLEPFFKIQLPKGYQFGRITSLVAGDTFKTYTQNMADLMIDPIVESDCIFITQYKAQSPKQEQEMKSAIMKLNQGVIYKKVELVNGDLEMKEAWDAISTANGQSNQRQYRHLQVAGGFLACFILYLYLELIQTMGLTSQLMWFQKVYNIFMGLILEMVPFVLIGTFIASLLQVLVTEKQLESVFGKHKWLGFPMAIILGIIFPVCDCALIPIAAKMMKKGVSIAHAMVFMTAAMVVNPIVLISTYYAFTNQPEMVGYRLVVGLIMSIGVSLIVNLSLRGTKAKQMIWKNSLLDEGSIEVCSSGYMGSLNFKGKLGKTEAIMRHTTLEFIYILPLVIIGALVSSILQASPLLQTTLKQYNPLILYGILIIACMTMSVCGSSNAFIARGFTKLFPVNFITGFMVMGPMLDFKNLLMMNGYLGKRFMRIYLISVLSVGLIVTLLWNLWI